MVGMCKLVKAKKRCLSSYNSRPAVTNTKRKGIDMQMQSQIKLDQVNLVCRTQKWTS